jgi:hypothetical protein
LTKRQRRRAEHAEAVRRAWVSQELGDRATAGLALDYVTLHADLAAQIRLAREAFVMPVQQLDPNKVTEEYEPDRTVTSKVIPTEWGEEEPHYLTWRDADGIEHRRPEVPDLNWEAKGREEIRAAERIRLGKLEGDYRTLRDGDLAGVPGWPLHPRLHAWLTVQVQDALTVDLLWGCLGVHKLLASVAKGGAEPLVKKRKAMEARWRYLIECFEIDLGRRPRQRGRRDLRGRVAIQYLDEQGVRRFG